MGSDDSYGYTKKGGVKLSDSRDKEGIFLSQFEVSELVVFSYLVGCRETGEALVIDPADEVETILGEARANNLKINYLVNTHTHVDHIMGNAEMTEKSGAKIIVHQEEAASLTNISLQKLFMFSARSSPPADILVKDGDTIKVGNISLKVLHTPGHSPGGICLHMDNLVFTGDTLFVGGVGRTDLPGGSWNLLVNSIKTKLFTLPDETLVLPGHNYGPAPTSTIGKEKLYNPFLR